MLASILRGLILAALNGALASAHFFGPTFREPRTVSGPSHLDSLIDLTEAATRFDHGTGETLEKLEPASFFHKISTFHNVGLMAFSKPEGLMNYERMLSQPGGHLTSILALLMWAFFLAWMLITTAEYYFCPPLMYWTRKLKLQPEVAGATLLAFGNGAPDVFTAQAAIRASDIPLLLGEMLGANAFLLCVVMGSLILASQGRSTAIPAKSRFLYNIVWYIMAVLANFIIISDGTITIVESSFLLVSYVMYVISLIYWNARQPSTKIHRNDPRLTYGTIKGRQGTTEGDTPGADWVSGIITNDSAPPPLQGLKLPIAGSPLDWLFFGVLWPFYLIRWITIPPSDDCWDPIRRTLCALSPAGVTVLSYVVFGSPDDMIAWACVSACSCFLGVIFYCTTGDGPETPALYPVFTLLAKVSSCIWLAFLAAELTNVVKALGVGMGVPSALLGITVVAWGNSFGDLLSGLSVTRGGDGRLAVIAVFSSPLFSNLVGFGISSWMAAKANGGRVVIWQAEDMNTRIIVLMPLLAGLVCILIAAIIIWLAYHSVDYKSVPKSYWAFGLYACYGIFMGLEVLDIISPVGPN